MGGCGSKDKETKRDTALQKIIDKEKKTDNKKLKLLLLGAGESGKSTLFKQMRLLYTKEKEFNEQEKETFKLAVYKNVYRDIAVITAHVIENLGGFRTAEGKVAAATFNRIFHEANERARGKRDVKLVITDEAKDALTALWNDEAMQEAWENRDDLQVQDSLSYFMLPGNITRISDTDYEPTNHDILRTRIRTAGLIQEEFEISGAHLEMYDVGGQKNERSKWIQAFDAVTGVIFVAAISEYNQVMFEDHKTSRQDDAVQLFRDQLINPIWENTPFILFLNKTDLFREKLVKFPFMVENGEHQRNVDFPGPHIDPNVEYATDSTDPAFEECYVAACNYLQALYEGQASGNQNRVAPVYTKLTNSTDTQQMAHIMDSCKDIILRGNLIVGGWISNVPTMDE